MRSFHEGNIFELEGDVDDNPALAGDDWATLHAGGGSAAAYTGVLADPKNGVDATAFTGGGSKDTSDIQSWRHTSGSVPDKNDITNAYAASYSINGDLLIYFGADRYTTSGDANLGFWFFKDTVAPLPDGTFSGTHQNGDILILVNFQQGGTIPDVQALTWDNGNLVSLFAGSAECGGQNGDTDVCAITNSGPVDSPWDYTPKSGSPGIFPARAFFEGGINISQLIGTTECFASFLAESRSSTSVSASLKDFVAGSFPVCGVQIAMQCVSSELSDDGNRLLYSYEGTVINTGLSEIHDVEVMDSMDNPVGLTSATLAQGEHMPFKGTFLSAENPAKISATVTAATSQGGDELITAKTELMECPIELEPAISVTRTCSTRLENIDGMVVVAVDFEGEVCNTSSGSTAVGLMNIEVQDTLGTADQSDDMHFPIEDLEPGECAGYQGSYMPSSVLNNLADPKQGQFNGTATVTAQADFDGGVIEDQASYTCDLCFGG